jgi:hypothetical protein
MKLLLIILTLILMGSTIYLIKVIKDEYGYLEVPAAAIVIFILCILLIITLLTI